MRETWLLLVGLTAMRGARVVGAMSTARLLWRELRSVDGVDDNALAELPQAQELALIGARLAKVVAWASAFGLPGRWAAVWAARAVGLVP